MENKIKTCRRKQFFSFFTDFYDKLEEGKIKPGSGLTFSEQEKTEKLKTNFKKFYKDDLFMPTEVVDIPVSCDAAA